MIEFNSHQALTITDLVRWLKIFSLCVFMSLLNSTSAFAQGNQCSQLFLNDSINSKHEILKARSLEIIEHQNQLRKNAGLSLFEPKDYEKNLSKKPPAVINSDKRYSLVKSKLVLIEMNENMASTALLTDDVYSLNYVYIFEGAKIINAIPAAVYYISQMPEVINLYRGLSQQEMNFWNQADLTSLRQHPLSIKWGYSEPVAHFSVKRFHSGNAPVITAKIPRDILLSWAQNDLVTIGSEGDMNGKPYRIEIVVKSAAWEELLKYLN